MDPEGLQLVPQAPRHVGRRLSDGGPGTILAQRQKPERGLTERRCCLTSAGAGAGASGTVVVGPVVVVAVVAVVVAAVAAVTAATIVY